MNLRCRALDNRSGTARIQDMQVSACESDLPLIDRTVFRYPTRLLTDKPQAQGIVVCNERLHRTLDRANVQIARNLEHDGLVVVLRFCQLALEEPVLYGRKVRLAGRWPLFSKAYSVGCR